MYLRDVATEIVDGPAAPQNYFCMRMRPALPKPMPEANFRRCYRAGETQRNERHRHQQESMKKIGDLRQGYLIPADLKLTVTRNYGETAKDKSNELLKHLLLATLSVTLLIALALGWRESRSWCWWRCRSRWR